MAGDPVTRPALPAAFAQRMREQLGADAGAYFAAMEEPYQRGIRLNPRKPIPLEFVAGLLEPIPWEPNGYYLAHDSTAGSHPLHEAGAYYLQEPSAMIPARVLSPHKGERMLDLCAAPGGKSTQLADQLDGTGLLVCNEPVFSRAQVLRQNLERMGVTNALVVSADPSQLAEKWANAFDAILVDAPCSGEGMFRRHPETRLEWTESSPAGCAVRQRRILESAYAMLSPGGRLVYSTCTLNREENEATVESLLRAHSDLSLTPFAVPLPHGSLRNVPNGMLRVYPHEMRGEGHFIALLAKRGCGSAYAPTPFLPPCVQLSKITPLMANAYEVFRASRALPQPCAMLGDLLLSAPELPPLRGIKVLRAGLPLGILKGKVFSPDHGLAMALCAPFPFPTVPLSPVQAAAYLRGESLPLDTVPPGFALATFQGLPLGFGKGSDGQLKNHYPKGLRRP